MVSTTDTQNQFSKKYGATVGGRGASFASVSRVPTGYFPFDLASGGGFPRGCVSIIFGPEGSGKTSMALSAIGQFQKRWPDLACAFFDVENTFDPEWATRLGVNVPDLHLYRPDYAEQVVDMVEAFLYADDCGMVVVDSLAAFISTTEIEKDAESIKMGGSTILIGKMVRKVNTALSKARKEQRMPMVIYINQVRMKIGQYGNPETMPGGNAPRYQSSMTVRTYGKNDNDKKISAILPVRKIISAIIQKWKVKILATHSTWSMVLVAHKGLAVGEVDDWTVMNSYMKSAGVLLKVDKGWNMMGEVYSTQVECRAALQGNMELMDTARELIVDYFLDAEDATKVGGLDDETGGDADE